MPSHQDPHDEVQSEQSEQVHPDQGTHDERDDGHQSGDEHLESDFGLGESAGALGVVHVFIVCTWYPSRKADDVLLRVGVQLGSVWSSRV